ncbi:MAG: LUD domain-containing protein [Proteobacteria bacterium]|nr:LUD domain-containing protein [Pseudomonadota bacterium]
MSGRDTILAAIRNASDGAGTNRVAREAVVKDRLGNPPENLIPARGQLPKDQRVALFRQMAEQADATTARIDDWSDVPTAVCRYLADHNLPSVVKASPDQRLKDIPWSAQPALEVGFGRAEASDAVGVAVAHAGVAETGTVMITSGTEGSTTVNFLPETHIVLLSVDDMTGDYEEVWRGIRDEGGPEADGRFMPRTVNWITGPSRSGDIEQKLQLGVHGPRRLHIMIVGGAVGEADGEKI